MKQKLVRQMIEYGLSVSLNTSPRSPLRSVEDLYCIEINTLLYAPRKSSFAEFLVETVDDDDHQCGEEEEEPCQERMTSVSMSISPRALFSGLDGVCNDGRSRGRGARRDVSRQLEFDTEDLSFMSSGISTIASVTTSVASVVATFASATSSTAVTEHVGECGVCYQDLPKRSNHVFTLCGHLFCVSCLLKWWDTATTCPLCRADILEYDDDDVEANTTTERADVVANTAVVMDDMSDDMDDDMDDVSERWNENENDNPDINTNETHSSHNDDIRDNVTLIDLYLHQDSDLDVSFGQVSPSTDDMVGYYLDQSDIQVLRENREIAMTLFARMRFRDTLFEQGNHFLGSVLSGSFIPKNEWNIIMSYQNHFTSIQTKMYEFVIRKNSTISPTYEVNIFGFIKDVLIVNVNEDRIDYDWENMHEYVFVADVFTPTDFYLHSTDAAGAVSGNRWDFNEVRGYGGYNMNDGTVTTQELRIPFSEIRRLYRISGRELLDV